jgi:hypothetical protein
MGQAKTVGVILIAIALVIFLIASLFMLSGMSEGRLRGSGLMLGLGLTLVLVLPLLAVGVVMLRQGGVEARQFAQAEREKRILNIVQTHGQVRVGDVVIEMNLTRDQVRDYIYDLVGKGLFTGYINWQDGILYAKQASEMQTTKCPNCGGVREVVGKGIVKCPFCGSELFL